MQLAYREHKKELGKQRVKSLQRTVFVCCVCPCVRDTHIPCRDVSTPTSAGLPTASCSAPDPPPLLLPLPQRQRQQSRSSPSPQASSVCRCSLQRVCTGLSSSGWGQGRATKITMVVSRRWSSLLRAVGARAVAFVTAGQQGARDGTQQAQLAEKEIRGRLTLFMTSSPQDSPQNTTETFNIPTAAVFVLPLVIECDS